MFETKINLAMHYWKALGDDERTTQTAKWFRAILEIAVQLLKRANDLEHECRKLRILDEKHLNRRRAK